MEELKAGMLVLARNDDKSVWEIDTFGYCQAHHASGRIMYVLSKGYAYTQCVPFDKEHEHLLGTIKDANEPDFIFGEHVVGFDPDNSTIIGRFIKKDIDANSVCYCILTDEDNSIEYRFHCKKLKESEDGNFVG